jgi:flagellar assembly factor FliW
MTHAVAASGSSAPSAPQLPVPGEPRVFESRRFGRLNATPEQRLRFPQGLLGFEEYTEFLLVSPEALQPLSFLVACADPEVAFPILPAGLCQADYAPAFPPEALQAIEAAAEDRIEVLVICSLAQDTHTLHANLRGPVLLNATRRLALQVVLHDSSYSLRHLLGAS